MRYIANCLDGFVVARWKSISRLLSGADR